MLTTAALKEAVKGWGVDLVGVGSVDRWDGAPPENDPRTIMPNAKSVIGIGFRVHRGSHRGVEEGTYFSSYTLTGFADVNNVIAPLMQRRVASLVEDEGYEATTVMYHANRFGGGQYGTGRPALRADGSEKPAPDILFNFRIAAVLCGMGEIGYNRLLLTPEFGPSQRVYFIVTDAPLEPDPVLESHICDGCKACVRNCPAHAISATQSDDVEIPGVVNIHRGALDVGKCSVAHYGGLSPFTPEPVLRWAQNIVEGDETTCADGTPRPPVGDICAYLQENVVWTQNAKHFTFGPAVVCASCIRSCLEHLDRRGRLTRGRKTE